MAKDSSSQTWKKTPDRGSLWLIELITWIILHLGRTIGRLFLYPIVSYFILFSSTTRFSKKYLSRSLARKPGLLDIFLHYYSFANMLLDRVYLLSGKTQSFDVRLHGDEILEQLIKKNKGIILLGSHLGNFDLLRIFSSKYSDIKIKAVMNNHNQQKINQVFEKLNPSLKDEVINIGSPESMLYLKEFVQQGNLAGILADRVEADGRIVQCNFFNQATNFPSGPLVVASLIKAPVILCFAIHTKNNKYDVYFHHFSDRIELPRDSRQASLTAYMQKYASILEQHCKDSPYNWYNFYDFWKDDVETQ
ncbi:MAG: lipid A biosynthesis acyltransferase [Pseudomonadota bacterium]